MTFPLTSRCKNIAVAFAFCLAIGICIVLLVHATLITISIRRTQHTHTFHSGTNNIDTFISSPIISNSKRDTNLYDCSHNRQRRLNPKESEHTLEIGHPVFNPHKYTTDPYVQNSHNCYAYAADYLDPDLAGRCRDHLTRTVGYEGRKPSCFVYRPKPGRASGVHANLPHRRRMTCQTLLDGVMGDIPGSSVSSRDVPCPSGNYKIAFAVDPHKTFHFYRQDADERWSHKDAWRPVTRLDASGKPIIDPADADRKYSHANLSTFCNYVCVPYKENQPRILR